MLCWTVNPKNHQKYVRTDIYIASDDDKAKKVCAINWSNWKTNNILYYLNQMIILVQEVMGHLEQLDACPD